MNPIVRPVRLAHCEGGLPAPYIRTPVTLRFVTGLHGHRLGRDKNTLLLDQLPTELCLRLVDEVMSLEMV